MRELSQIFLFCLVKIKKTAEFFSGKISQNFEDEQNFRKQFSILVPDMLVRSDKDLCFYSTCQIGETSDSFHIYIL